MGAPPAKSDSGVSGNAYGSNGAAGESLTSRAQLRAGVQEISDATTDALDSLREATAGSAADIAISAREFIRERPLAAIAIAAGFGYLYTRITR